MSVSHLIQPYTTNFSSIGISSVKHIKWIVRPMPQWVCTSSARANQQHWPTIYPAFPTTLVEAMWDVWCLFSIIAAMICIGSGWNAVGWTGTLHLVTQSLNVIGTKRFFTANKETHHWRELSNRWCLWRIRHGYNLGSFSWKHQRWLSWSPGISLTFFEAPVASPVYEQNIASSNIRIPTGSW